jgi:uncharacterized membrane protein
MPRAASALATAVVLATLIVAGAAPPVAAAGTLTLTTPFPAIAVQPGSTATFTLTLGASAATTAELTVSGVPDGWTAGLHGSGLEVESVYVPAGGTATLQLDLSIPPDAADGRSAIVVNARDGSSSVNLALAVSVAQAAGGTVELTTDFPTLRGASTATFPFTLQLRNNTPQQLTFSLQAAGPTGWTVTAQPTGQEQAASFTVDAGSTRSITVSASAPDSVEAGQYPIDVQAIGSAGRTAEAQLTVEISGSVKMSLTTADGRLNASATAGSVGDLSVVVSNDGTSPLTGLNLTASPPSDWQVTFDQPTIDTIAAGQTATVTAHIQPSGDAIAGDYVVTVRASNDQASKSMDIRVTVDTSPVWGAVGIILVLAAVGGLYLVFQHYGRR